MVKFSKIRWKNFLSTGNYFTEVSLDSSETTLIMGKNGHGKSTILDAITFALFGKAFRNINKPQIVNSINQKNCVVEVEFSIGKSNYKVIRGIKPVIFEIHCNDSLLNQDSASKDYQKVLEQQILKFNYRTFTQVVILGSASFVPFMQLPAAARREVIEDILDIKVFSVMNNLLKEEMQKTKDSINAVEALVDISKERVQAQQKVILILEEGANQEREKTSKEIAELEEDIEQNNAIIQELSEQVAVATNELNSSKKTLKKLVDNEKSKLSDAKSKLKHTCDNITFFKNNDTCVTCSQELNADHKKTMIKHLTEEGAHHSKLMNESNLQLTELENQLEELDKIQDVITQKNSEISSRNGSIYNANSRIKKLKASLNELDVSKIAEEKAKLKEIASSAIDAVNRKQELMNTKHVQEISSLLLKDTGIKTTIIKEYLPVFNKLINKYLSLMDFYVNFEIDETFSEKIKSRGRDEFTYSSFSEGEKQKIDLALLFTFRQIAKMKNSLSTNLLLMDEVLDGSLDANGIEYVINILQEIGEDDTNIFVISHNVEFTSSEIFSKVLQFEKKNDFSVMIDAKAKYAS